MSGKNSNQNRAFADLVSIDAWHDEFDGKVTGVFLHTDVVFGRAAFGGEVESEVSFRLSLKNAELVLVVPDTEPAIIDPRHIARHDKVLTGTRDVTTENSKEAGAGGIVSAQASAKGLNAKAEAKAIASTSSKVTEKTTLTETMTAFEIVQSKDADDNYRWIIDSAQNDALTGKPWNPHTPPLAKILDKRPKGSKNLPPTVRVEVRCRRENLIIEEIKLKAKGKKKSFAARILSPTKDIEKIKAAEAYIRNQLSTEGLEAKHLSEEFSTLTIASVTPASLPPENV